MELLGKIRRKGWRGTLRVLCERFIYRHQELLTVERSLEAPLSKRLKAYRWEHVRINEETLPKLKKHFAHYLPAVRKLLAQEGVRGDAFADESGDAIGMVWMTNRDYYEPLYHRWIRLPPGHMYQFAGEVAEPYRNTGIPLRYLRALCEQGQHELGCHVVRALADVRNLPAITMHMHMGFRETGEATHVYTLFGVLRFMRIRAYREPRFPSLRKPDRNRISPQGPE
jgi:RimJ/RimL family protein N-acetyltransferase